MDFAALSLSNASGTLNKLLNYTLPCPFIFVFQYTMLIYQSQNTVLWINVNLDNSSFVHPSRYCPQPLLQSSLLAPLLTHSWNFITHSLNSSILTIPWSLIPYYSKNRGWAWSLPKWTDSSAGRGVIKTAPWKLHSGELSTLRSTSEVAALRVPWAGRLMWKKHQYQ